MSTEWLPRAVYAFGYRFGTVLAAQNVFARLAMTHLLLGAHDLPHTYRTFENEGDAVAWLAVAREVEASEPTLSFVAST